MAKQIKRNSEKKISVVVLNWNTKDLLTQCVQSLEKELSFLDSQSEIILVDNGSTDGSVETINSLEENFSQHPKISILKILNKDNLGYTKGNNLGIKAASGEYIMILNTDTIVQPGSIRKMIEFLENHPEFHIIGPQLLNPDGTPQANCGRFPHLKTVALMLFKEHFKESQQVRFSPERSQEVEWLMGAAFIARKEVFEKTGGFDENIFMYMEEVEWFYRARKAGFKAYFLKDAQITHLGRGSSKTGKTQPILNIYRGVIYFYQKHKSKTELIIVRLLLKIKAFLALILGYLKNDNYLKTTYAQALKIH